MKAPTLKMCKTPRLLQRYLAALVRSIQGEQGVAEVAIFYVGDDVLVLEDGEKHPGVITEVHGGGLYEVDFDDGDDGCYGAEDFC